MGHNDQVMSNKKMDMDFEIINKDSNEMMNIKFLLQNVNRGTDSALGITC